MDMMLWTAFAVLALLLLLVVIFKMYLKLTTGWCKSQRRMDNKTVVITGANSGIGKETAREMAKRGARVILACKCLQRGNAAAQELIESTKNEQIYVKQVDLSSLQSVREFCSDLISTEDRLDVLVLNAGMVPPPGRFLTSDLLELQFVTNHLGHFLLTNLLLDLLEKSAPARVVIVSSVLHHLGKIDFENLSFEKYTPDPFFTYCMSKLCNILMAKELSRRLEGRGVTVNALHPGLVRTDINRRTPWYIKNVIQPLTYTWAKSTEEGAQTTIHLSVSEEVDGVSGKYFSDCGEVWTSSKCDDQQLAQKVWRVSELMTGLRTSL